MEKKFTYSTELVNKNIINPYYIAEQSRFNIIQLTNLNKSSEQSELQIKI